MPNFNLKYGAIEQELANARYHRAYYKRCIAGGFAYPRIQTARPINHWQRRQLF